MRFKVKGPKHGAEKANILNSKAVNSIKGFKNEYVLFGAGITILLVTSICSITFAVNSKTGTAINTAYEALDSDLIYNGVFIEEVNIGGLTKEQAIRRATDEYAGARLDRIFTISYGRYSKDVTYADLGASYDIKKTVDEAYKIGRTGSKKKRIETAQSIEDKREFLVSEIEINTAKMKSVLKEISKELESTENLPGSIDYDIMIETIATDMRMGLEDRNYNIAFK